MASDGLLDVERVERYLSEQVPALEVRKVNAATRFPAGLSSLSCRIDLLTEQGLRTVVIRAEPEHGVIPPYDIVAEYELMSRVSQGGLPVPEMLHLEADPEVFGTRFLVMSYLEGEMFRSSDPRVVADAALAEQLKFHFVEMLARIHLFDGHGLHLFTDAAEAARAEVRACRRRLAETQVLPNPALEHALDVLEANAPPGQRQVLLHGDYRLPNLKWRDGKLVGILDWELARVGDPISDVCFTQTVGIGACSITGDLLDRYLDLTGFDVDDQRLAYYQLLEMVKGTIIGLAAAKDILNGGSDLRLLSVAGLAASAVPVVGMLEQSVERVEAR